MTETSKATLYRLGLITLVVLAAYGAVLSHGFVWDDFDIIVNNPLLAKLSNIPRFFLTEDKVSAATGFYRPVTYLSFALDRALWGLNPLGFNITNLLLQVATSLLFFAVVRALFRREDLALAAALVFALHPLAVETVNFHAGGRNTLLSACFALLSLYFYLKERQLPAVASFALAIFSKEFALLLPLVFLFHELRVKGEKPRLARYLPYLAVIAGYLALRSLAVQKANFLGGIRLNSQLWLTPYLAVRYLINMIFPFRLKVMYDEQTTVTVCVISLVLVLALIGALFVAKRHRELVFGDFWFLLFLLPVINIIPIVSNTLIADRYGYFSLMGFSIVLGALVCRLKGWAQSACLATILAAFLATDLSQGAVWKDETTLFTRMAQDAPQMSIGYRNLGLHYYSKGDLSEACRYLLLAAQRPDIQPGQLVGAASILMEANQPVQAEALLTKSLTQDPGNPEPYLLLALLYRTRGDGPAAEVWIAKARQAIPGLETEKGKETAAFVKEGETLRAQGRLRQAANLLWRALVITPDHLPALVRLGQVRLEEGNLEEAAGYLRRAVELDPGQVEAHFLLAKLYQRQGRSAEAQQEMERGKQGETAGQGGKPAPAGPAPAR